MELLVLGVGGFVGYQKRDYILWMISIPARQKYTRLITSQKETCMVMEPLIRASII